jgi:branched-chain amino acid transport system substrate-binding protein
VRVSAIATVTGPAGVDLQPYFSGILAHFDMVNAEGGVNGRELVLVEQRDDRYINGRQEAQAALAQDDIFAILTGSYAPQTPVINFLEGEGVPLIGTGVTDEWVGRETAFYLPQFPGNVVSPVFPQLARELGKERIGLLGYSDAASSECVDSTRATFEHYAPDAAEVVYSDTSISFGDYSPFPSVVARMKEADVDLILTCMDLNAVLTLAREKVSQQLDANQIALNMYNPEFVAANADVFEGDVVMVGYAVPELAEPPAPVQQLLEWTERGGYEVSEDTYSGWAQAATFVEGLRGAGEEPSRAAFMDHLRSLTDWTAEGFIPGVNYQEGTAPGATPPEIYCFGTPLTIRGGAFVSELPPAGTPFLCGDITTEELPTEILWR